MDRRMCFIILLSIFRASPLLTRCYSLCKISKHWVMFKLIHDLSEVYSRIEAVSFCSRVAEYSPLIKLLHDLHCHCRWQLEFPRYHFLSFNCVKRNRSRTRPPALNYISYSGLARILAFFKKYQACQLVEDSFSDPLKFEFTLLPAIFRGCQLWSLFHLFLILQDKGPKLLRGKISYLLMPVNNKSQCRELAWTIWQHSVAWLMLAAKEDISEVKSLESGKTSSYPQVYLLPDTYCLGLISIRLN